MPLRVAIDCDGTIVGHRNLRDGSLELELRPGVMGFLRELSLRGHALILWTIANRSWIRMLSARFPEIFELFDEVYTRDGLPCPWKDIRVIRADALIDDDLSYKRRAERLGFGHRYIWVPEFVPGRRPRADLDVVLRLVDSLSRSSHNRRSKEVLAW